MRIRIDHFEPQLQRPAWSPPCYAPGVASAEAPTTGERDRHVEYKGFEIVVRPEYVVIGDDPMGDVIPGFAAEICKRDGLQDDPYGRVMWDYPFGAAESHMQAATEGEVVEMAKAFIDAGGKRGGDPFASRKDIDEEDQAQ